MVERPDATEGRAVPLPGVDASGAGPPAGAGATGGDPVPIAASADAGRTDGLAARLADHVEPGERVRVAWVVRRADTTQGDGAARRTVYAVTDRRLLAVEPERPVRSTPFARRPAAPALALGAGLLVAVLAFLGGAAAASGWTALLLVVTCVGGLALAERGRQLRRAPPESRERPATVVTAVGVAVDDGAVVRGSGAEVGAVGGGEETTAGGDAGTATAAGDGEAAAGDPAPATSRAVEEAVAAGDDD